MATMDAKLVGLFISTDLVTPAYLEVICATDTGLDGTTEVTSVDTKCGFLKSPGSTSWTMNVAGVVEMDPDAGMMSANELIALAQAGTRFLVKIADTGGTPVYYRQGEGFFTSFSETANNGENVTFEGTIEIDGDLDIVP